jgi:hypothetical protein
MREVRPPAARNLNNVSHSAAFFLNCSDAHSARPRLHLLRRLHVPERPQQRYVVGDLQRAADYQR